MKNISNNRKFLILYKLSCICIIILSISILPGCDESNNIKASKQSDYPILPDLGSFVEYIHVSSLRMIVQDSDLVIEGTVGNTLSSETTDYIPQSGTAEAEILSKTDQSGYQITKYAVKITIDDILKGTADKAEIILYRSSIIIDTEPQLTQGDRLIFFLHRDSSSDGYIIMAPHEGYFYVAGDGKVYPTEVTEGLKNTSGMSLNKFKQEIKSYLQ